MNPTRLPGGQNFAWPPSSGIVQKSPFASSMQAIQRQKQQQFQSRETPSLLLPRDAFNRLYSQRQRERVSELILTGLLLLVGMRNARESIHRIENGDFQLNKKGLKFAFRLGTGTFQTAAAALLLNQFMKMDNSLISELTRLTNRLDTEA